MKNIWIEYDTLKFLRNLSKHNNRVWFNAHKLEYVQAQQNVEQFVDALISRMNKHDRIETTSGKKSLYRIYNDVRFAKDKSPYNPRFAGYLKRSKPLLRGGYYFWITPGGSRLGCGFSHPNAEDLKRTRLDIASNYEDWHKLLNLKSIVSSFGVMKGEQVKTTPRGFPKDHPAIDLLRYKQYWFDRTFTDHEVLSVHFITHVNNTFKTIRPFFDYMSEVLTTNPNGEPMID